MTERITHGELLDLVIKKDEDYDGFGKRIRWENPDEDYEDCSCGCRYYLKLRGELGGDWGVCVNKKSHRCGILTFEHQGCQQYEHDYDDDGV